MSFCRTYTVTVSTDGSGDGTAYSAGSNVDDAPPNGRILGIHYDGGLAATADVTVTAETTGTAIWTELNLAAAAADRAPRQATHAAADGSASLYAAAGEPVEDYIWVSNERIKVVIAQGGASDSGVFTFTVG